MSLRNRLILSTAIVGFILSLISTALFLVIAGFHLRNSVKREYERIFKTYSFVLKTVSRNSNDVVVRLKKCKVRKAESYLLLRDRLLVGRVEGCIFYGTDFKRVIELTAGLNDLRWFIVYDRSVVENLLDESGGILDRFVGSRTSIGDYLIDGYLNPELLKHLKDLSGYTLINDYSLLLVDFPILVEDSIPVGRVIFVKDFSEVLRNILFAPAVFLIYTILLVIALSAVLFLLFNRIVRDVAILREMAYRFKELDFSYIPKMSDMLRKERKRDELFYLKRSILTMAQELEALINQLKEEKDKLEGIAYADPLTGLSNRRLFFEETKRLLELARRHGEPFSIIMLDVDNFKRINDEYGHDVGDIVLKNLAEAIRINVRSSDIAARYGGEEFIIALPKTDGEGALLVAERIRQDFKRRKVKINQEEVGTTVSVGVASYKEGDDLETLIKKADEALYEAKRTGKDKVVMYREEDREKD